MPMVWTAFQLLILAIVAVYHRICMPGDRRRYPPPGNWVEIDGCRLHYYSAGTGSPTIVFDHSVGSLGWANYQVFTELAKTNRIVICDRAGYGWSDASDKPRTSQQVVSEFAQVLERANIEPPYILVGDSFGGYTMRLYAQQYPENVAGMVLTHCLHEELVLNYPWKIELLWVFLTVIFKIVEFLAPLGWVRLMGILQVFELLKPELRRFPPEELNRIKFSYYQSKHWGAMFSEMQNLKISSRQMQPTQSLGSLPLVVIEASTFLQSSPLMDLLPRKLVDRTWSQMQQKLLELSDRSQLMFAENSSHFVWVDRPDVMIAAVRTVLEMIENDKNNYEN